MQGMLDTMEEIRLALQQGRQFEDLFSQYLRADAADRGLDLDNF